MKYNKKFVVFLMLILFMFNSITAKGQTSNYSIQPSEGFYQFHSAFNGKSIDYWQSTNDRIATLRDGYLENGYFDSTAFSSELTVEGNSSILSVAVLSLFVYNEKQIVSNNVSHRNDVWVRDGSDYYGFYQEIRGVGANASHFFFEIIVYRRLSIDYAEYFRKSFQLTRVNNASYTIDLIFNGYLDRVNNVNRFYANMIFVMETNKKESFYANLVYNFGFTSSTPFSFYLLSSSSRSNTQSTIASNLVGTRFWVSTSYRGYLANSLLLNNRISNVITIVEFSQSKYWIYSSPMLQSYSELINVTKEYEVYNENDNSTKQKTFEISYNYNKFNIIWETRYYYYEDIVKNSAEWGNWGLWNWLRDGLTAIVNTLNVIIQFILYLLVIALNYLLWTPLCYVIWLVNNFVLFFIAVGITYVAFGIAYVFIWLWNRALILWKTIIEPAIIWLWNYLMQNVFNPIYEWLKNGGLKTLLELYLTVVSYILAVILYVFTFGTQDFTQLQQAIQTLLFTINNAIFEFVSIFFENFFLIIQSSATYILLVGLVYVKYLYTKARGYVTRANRLQSMINVYKLPLVLSVRLLSYIIGFIQGGTPMDGSDN